MEFKTALGAEYALISATEPINKRRWKSIEKAVSTFDPEIILPLDLQPPVEMEIIPYFPSSRFLPIICANTVSKLLSISNVEKPQRVAGLIDLKATRQPLALRLLKEASSVVVLTNEPERYEAFSEEVFESTGAPVLIAEPGSSLSGCSVIAAPDGVPIELCSRNFPAVVCAIPVMTRPSFKLFCSLELSLTEELAQLVPLGIDPVTFFGALYEKCKISTLEELTASQGRIDGIMTTVAQFAKTVFR